MHFQEVNNRTTGLLIVIKFSSHKKNGKLGQTLQDFETSLCSRGNFRTCKSKFQQTKKDWRKHYIRKARIDFIWETNISEMFPLLEQQVKELIESDKPIISAFSNEADEIRYLKIEGFGQVPCGGTHMKSTSELGALKLKRDRQGKSKERIEIYLA